MEHGAHAGTNIQLMIYQTFGDNSAHHVASPGPVLLSLNLFQTSQGPVCASDTCQNLAGISTSHLGELPGEVLHMRLKIPGIVWFSDSQN